MIFELVWLTGSKVGRSYGSPPPWALLCLIICLCRLSNNTRDELLKKDFVGWVWYIIFGIFSFCRTVLPVIFKYGVKACQDALGHLCAIKTVIWQSNSNQSKNIVPQSVRLSAGGCNCFLGNGQIDGWIFEIGLLFVCLSHSLFEQWCYRNSGVGWVKTNKVVVVVPDL